MQIPKPPLTRTHPTPPRHSTPLHWHHNNDHDHDHDHNHNKAFDSRLPSRLCVISMSNPGGRLMAERDSGAAMTRRQRRLRSWWRHEQQSSSPGGRHSVFCYGRRRCACRRLPARPGLTSVWSAGAFPAAHRGADRQQCAGRAVSRCSCAVGGAGLGARPNLAAARGATFSCTTRSRRSKCPISCVQLDLLRLFSPPRRWWNCWWKCRGSPRRAFSVFLCRRWRISWWQCRRR